MPDYYGMPRSATGGVPVGGDLDVGYFIMSAPKDKHLRVVAGGFLGGDAGETYRLFIWPAGTIFPTTITNAIPWAGGALAGAEANAISISQNQDRQSMGFLVIPAGWSLGIIPISGASAASAEVSIVGLPFDAQD